MEIAPFHHALMIDQNKCTGCTHCMQVCPTQAIRVFNGKARMFDNRCIDCGECLRSCPVSAIRVEDDDFNKIYNYKHRVLLIPTVLIGQFSEELDESVIHEILIKIGFHEVFEIDTTTDLLVESYNNFITANTDKKPLISTFCPAIVRLIQVKFPSLTENLILVKAPIDVAAAYNKKLSMEKGINPDDIGIFYVTPCAAKIAAIKSPVGEDKSVIDGIINLKVIYNKICKELVNLKKTKTDYHPQLLKKTGLQWSLTGGESVNFQGRCLAIDEIHNVINFLEKIENEEIIGIDFLELRACDQSCAGGILTAENRFITVERIKNRIKMSEQQPPVTNNIADKDREYILKHSVLKEIKPRSMMVLDDNVSEALHKMQRIKEIRKNMPGVDCGACGSPGCDSMAEDIVKGLKNINHCIFFQKSMEKQGNITIADSVKLMEEIWGSEKIKFNKK